MDVEQHPVALLAVLERLLCLRLVRDVLADAVIPPEPPLGVENRLAGPAQVAGFAVPVVAHVDEVGERLVTLELLPVLPPHPLGERRQSRKLPACLADEDLLADAALFHAGQPAGGKILV